MNSLQDLNSYGTTNVTYTDSRDSDVKFDRAIPTNATVELERKDSHTVPVGINIEEVIGTPGIVYTVNLSSNTDATLTWPSLPAGVTASTPSTGIYQLTGIDSVSDWNQVKSPTISLAVGYTGEFTYQATITYNSTQSRYWEVAVTVAEIVFFEDPAPEFFFANGAVNLLDPSELITDKAGNFTVTLTPSNTGAITSVASAIADPTPVVSFNGTTKVTTLTGTNAQVKTYLQNLNITYASGATTAFNMVYDGVSDNADASADTVTQVHTPTLYLTKVAGAAEYTTAVVSDIENYPTINNIVADPNALLTNTYTLTVTPNDPSIIDTITATGWQEYPVLTAGDGGITGEMVKKLRATASSVSRLYTYDSGSNDGYDRIDGWNPTRGTSNKVLDDFDISRDTSVRVAVSSGGSGAIYSLVSGTETSLTLAGAGAVSLNYNGTVMVVSGTNLFALYTRSGSTWTQRWTASTTVTAGNTVRVSGNGQYFAIGDQQLNSETGRVRVYNWDGTNATLQATFTGDSTDDNFGSALEINDAGDELFIGAHDDNTTGRAFYYTRNSTTWTLTQTINPYYTSNIDFGGDKDSPTYDFYIDQSYDGNYLVIPANLTLFIYKKVSGVWTLWDHYNTSGLGVLNDNGQNLYFTNLVRANNAWVGTSTLATTGVSFNTSTKVLTFTGSKSRINTALATLQLTSTSQPDWPFTLTYAVTTPASATESRTQTVNNIG
jgi:hypothetical protein